MKNHFGELPSTKDLFVNLSNPGKENSYHQVELEEILKDVLKRGQYILGEQVKFFERNFANYCGTDYCVSVASGSDALIIALKAMGCKANDKIVTVPNAGFYSTAAILSMGAQPVYVDICEKTMAMSIDSLEHILNNMNDVRCVVATHLYGAMINIDRIADLTKKHDALLLEDCSQAHGAKYKGRVAGAYGDAGVYSFYPTKNLGAIGDGGAIITGSAEINHNALKLRQYGWSDKYKVAFPGGQNSRLDELQAAVLNFKLGKLNELNEARKLIVRRYASIPFRSLRVFNIEGSNFVAHLAIVRTKHRDKLREFLTQNKIACDIHFPILDYKQAINLLADTHCNNAEKIVNNILSIPCHPSMAEDEISYVIDKLIEFDKHI